MKVVFFVPKLINCGPLNVVLGIVRVLSLDPSISIKIVTYRDNHLDNNFRNLFKDIGILEFYSLEGCSNPVNKLLYLKSIVKDANVIHSHGFFPDLYSSILPSNIVKIATAHSMFFKDYPATYGSLKGYPYALLHHLVYFHPSLNKVASCSKSVQNYFNKLFLVSRNKVLTIHNGVDQQTFCRVSDIEKAAIKGRLLLPNLDDINLDSNVFIFSGRLTRLKRVPELISWFNTLADSSDSSNVLIILGNGEEMELCKQVAKNNKNILFMGFVDDITPYYQMSDYLLSFSAFEGFPMSVLEGISCGCKAILSDIPSHREIIERCPTMAILQTDFMFNTLTFSWSDDSAYYLSSVRMAEEYKSIYESES